MYILHVTTGPDCRSIGVVSDIELSNLEKSGRRFNSRLNLNNRVGNLKTKPSFIHDKAESAQETFLSAENSGEGKVY